MATVGVPAAIFSHRRNSTFSDDGAACHALLSSCSRDRRFLRPAASKACRGDENLPAR